jgi:hypothetical protein
MQQSLKLTITAVGEPGSIFMRPVSPITLHDSKIDVDDDSGSVDLYEDEVDRPAERDTADGLSRLDGPEVFILADTPPKPDTSHRRAS